MTAQDKATLKGYFNTGDVPSEGEFEDLIDSAIDASALQTVIDAHVIRKDVHYIPRHDTIILAADDAYADSKLQADHICNGSDDDADLNTAFEDIETSGGSVKCSEGHFVIAQAVEILASNVKFMGAGAGITVLDSSALRDLTQPRHTYNIYGTLTIDSNAAGPAIKNILVTGMTIKSSILAPVTPWDHRAIYCGGVEGLYLDHLCIDGSYYEAVYHDGGGFGSIMTDWHVSYCEFKNTGLLALNNNDATMTTAFWTNNYLHDSAGAGMNFAGLKTIITGNIFEKLGTFGVLIESDYCENASIHINKFHNIGHDGIDETKAISVVGTVASVGHHIDISDNFIYDMETVSGHTATAIYVSGHAIVKNNIIRGTLNGYGSYGIQSENVVSAETSIIDGNVILPMAAEVNRYKTGIYAAGAGPQIIQNNIVMKLAVIQTPGSGFDTLTYADQITTEDIVLINNIFNGPFWYRGVAYNNSAELDNCPIITNDIIFRAFPTNDTTPSVKGGKLFYTLNTSPTTIDMFDDGYVGQDILVHFGDANTTVNFGGGSSYLNGNAGVDYNFKVFEYLRATCIGTNTWICEVHKTMA